MLHRVSGSVAIGLWLPVALWMFTSAGWAGQHSRYSSEGWQDPSATKNWSDPNDRAREDDYQAREDDYRPPKNRRQDAAIRSLLKELRGLVRDAARQRAADPRFLGDLRELARRYARPRLKLVLFDNFSDGNFSAKPAWRAAGSGIRVSSYYGLQLRQPRYQPAQNNQSNRRSARDELIGSILGQLTGQKPRQQSRRQPVRPRPARLTVAAAIPNAFAIELAFGSESLNGGRFLVGVTQGKRRLGYRLAYNPGSTQPIELIRRGNRGSAIIDATYGKLKLEDGRLHKIQLTRDRRGEMTVRVDGKVLIRTVDRAFRGKFDGVVMVNLGGDYTIRSIRVDGAR
jgi:hypothetical protein